MKEYEIVLTYLNGCAGAAYPQVSFEEAEVKDLTWETLPTRTNRQKYICV